MSQSTDGLNARDRMKQVHRIVTNSITVAAAEDRYEIALMQVEKLLSEHQELIQSLHDAVCEMRFACVTTSYHAGLVDGVTPFIHAKGEV